MDGPRYIPLETTELARALLLVRLRERCPPPPPLIPPPCEPCRCPDTFEPSDGPIRFSKFLERQNEEYRAARELDRLRELSEPRPDRFIADTAAPELAAPRPTPTDASTSSPAAPPANIPKPRTTTYQRLPTQTGRLIDIFL